MGSSSDITSLAVSHRSKEYDLDDDPWEPISGAASALVGTIGSLMMGVADIPLEMFKKAPPKTRQAMDRVNVTNAETDDGEGNNAHADRAGKSDSKIVAFHQNTKHHRHTLYSMKLMVAARDLQSVRTC